MTGTAAYLPPKQNTCTPPVPEGFAHTAVGLVLQHSCGICRKSGLAEAVMLQCQSANWCALGTADITGTAHSIRRAHCCSGSVLFCQFRVCNLLSQT